MNDTFEIRINLFKTIISTVIQIINISHEKKNTFFKGYQIRNFTILKFNFQI